MIEYIFSVVQNVRSGESGGGGVARKDPYDLALFLNTEHK